jgi:hypothetical protein
MTKYIHIDKIYGSNIIFNVQLLYELKPMILVGKLEYFQRLTNNIKLFL